MQKVSLNVLGQKLGCSFFHTCIYIFSTILQSHPARDFCKNEQEVSEIFLEYTGPPIGKSILKIKCYPI